MNKSITILLTAMLASASSMNAQVIQKGNILEYNGAEQKTPLSRAIPLVVKKAGTTLTDASNGMFELNFPESNIGDPLAFAIMPRLSGYEVFNKEALENWNLSTNRALPIVFCRKDRWDALVSKYYDISFKNFESKYNVAKKALDEALKANQMKEEEYKTSLTKLETTYYQNLEKIDTYAERFARIDQSALNGSEQHILALVDEGRVDEAIDEYAKLNIIDKLVEASRNVNQLNQDIKTLEAAKASQEESRDSLIQMMRREVKLLQLAGGAENWDRASAMLKQYADCNPESYEAQMEYLEHLFRLPSSPEKDRVHQLAWKLAGNDPDRLSKVFMLTGNVYRCSKEETLQEMQRLYNLCSAEYDKEHTPETDVILGCVATGYGQALVRAGKAEGEAIYDKAERLLESAYQADSVRHAWKVARYYMSRGSSYYVLQQPELASEKLHKALQYASILWGVDKSKVFIQRYTKLLTLNALVHNKLKQYDKSIDYLLQVEKIQQEELKINPRGYLTLLLITKRDLCEAYHGSNQPEKALQAGKECIELFLSDEWGINLGANRESVAFVLPVIAEDCQQLNCMEVYEDLHQRVGRYMTPEEEEAYRKE